MLGTGGQTETGFPLEKARERVRLDTFRRTCASLLFEAGKDVKQVSEWLGHADPAFALRTYVHLMDAGLGDAAFLDDAVKPERLTAEVEEDVHRRQAL